MKTLTGELGLSDHEYSKVLGNCMYCNCHIRFSVLQLEQMESWNRVLASRNERPFTPANFQPCDACFAKNDRKERSNDAAWDRHVVEKRQEIKSGIMTKAGFETWRDKLPLQIRERYKNDIDAIAYIFVRKEEKEAK
jgi:hypothetical protein